MEVMIERACGLDVHKDSITGCIITPNGKEIQTFSTKTVFLLKLLDWIKDNGCSHVAMESTSVYWKPIVNLLESEEIEFLVVNAQHIKAVPGRVDSLNALLTKTVTYPELVGKSNLEIHQKIYKIPLCFLNEHYGHDAISLLQGNLGARIAFLQILRQILPRYLLL
jgi:hypothetical protein